MDNLKQKTLDSMIWSGMDSFGQQGIQFVVGIILARLLLPEHFGVIAILMIFIQVAQAFIDSGFSTALIQKKETTYADECSVFYFNLLISIASYGILYITSPWIAVFFKQDVLVKTLRIISLTLIINAVAQIHMTLLAKKLNFKKRFKSNLSGIIGSAVIGIYMAYKGFGVWALVGQQVSRSIIQTVTYWFISPWRPALIFQLNAIKQLFSFGSKLLFSGLLDTIFANIYSLFIGKLYSSSSLGFYSRGRNIPFFAMSSVITTITSVMFPVFSKVQNEPERLKYAVKKSLEMTSLMVMLMMTGLAVIAEPLVRILLRDKWLPCVPYLRIICFVCATWPIHVINLQAIAAMGRTDIFLRLEIIKKILIIVSVLVTFKFGIMALVSSQIVTSIIGIFINGYYNGRLIKYSSIQQLKDLFPIILISIFMGACIWQIERLGINNLYFLVAAQVSAGITISIGICYLFKISSFYELLSIAKDYSSKLSLS
jgi:teichuronic acid exporter